MNAILYTSPRMLIRRFLHEEEELFYRFFEDPQVTTYLPKLSADVYKELFNKTFEDYKNGPFGRWGIFDPQTGGYIGNCLLRVLAEEPGAYEIGYSIAPEFWGRGMASEIASALIAYAFAHLDSGDLTAVTHPENIASQKVLLKSGFYPDGEIERLGQPLTLFRLKRPIQ